MIAMSTPVKKLPHKPKKCWSKKVVTAIAVALMMVLTMMQTVNNDMRTLVVSWREGEDSYSTTTTNPVVQTLNENNNGIVTSVQAPPPLSLFRTSTWFMRRPSLDRQSLLGYKHENNHSSFHNATAATVHPRIVVLGGKRGSKVPYIQSTQAMMERKEASSSSFPEDEFNMERRSWPRDETNDKCKPMHDWQSWQFPVCNTVHENNIRDSISQDEMSLISKKGYWRDAWRKEANGVTNQTIVWKTFKLVHNMEDFFFESQRVDALAMERLTRSPYIIDIYSFCGMTVAQEYAGKEIFSVPFHLEPQRKLKFATQVAQALVDVHSIDGQQQPSLVHNDINLANLLITDDGRPVLNDFNIAVLLKKHNETGETCPFPFKYINPQWRAPEEQRLENDRDGDSSTFPLVTEKIDVYALGNVFYRLLVGRSPWKEPNQVRLTLEQKDRVAYLKHINGTLPYLPPQLRNSSHPAIRSMRKAMLECYRFNPKVRPSARAILDILTQNQTGSSHPEHKTRGTQIVA